MSAEEQWVEVTPHDDRWFELYRIEAQRIELMLGEYALGIEHFGSTAVPGLLAKPIVDILVGARDGSGPGPAISGLTRLGYEYLGEDGRRPGRYFWRKRGADAFNVSVVPYRGLLWQTNIDVRDFLRIHPEWATRYGFVKLSAAARSQVSMLRYQDQKREFLDALRAAATAWAEGRRPDAG